jgi:hypothetical protein
VSFNVLALITIAGRIKPSWPCSLASLLLNRYVGFLFQTSETKNTYRYGLVMPDFSGDLRVTRKSSYAYEIYYVPKGSGSQSNVV